MDTSDSFDSRYLQSQLWYERCLNYFGDRLNNCITAYLNSAEEFNDFAIESPILESCAQELTAALKGTPVMIALANANEIKRDDNHATLTFTVRYTSALESARSHTSPWLLPAGQPVSLDLGQTLTQQDLQFLHIHYPDYVWQLFQHEQCIGWLLIEPHTIAYTSAESPLLGAIQSGFIKRVLYKCKTALEHMAQLQVQRQQQRSLLMKSQELEHTNRLKSEFLANTSHEIRTPLSSILGFTHLLLQQGFNPINLRHQEYLKIILTSGQHLLALINDILDLSKIEANQMTLHWEPVEVKEICQVALTLVQEKANDKGLKLQLDMNSSLRTIVADSLRLKQMLFNLLSNAVKFTPRGTIGLQVVPSNGFLHFTVWDTGTGISEEHQALLFQPYSQIANQATTRGEGTGLGLVLTQKLAELHGGRIEVKSELDRGSRFTIILPANHPTAQPLETLSTDLLPSSSHAIAAVQASMRTPLESVSQSESGTGSGADAMETVIYSNPNRILLVEDNVHNAKLMLTYLSRLGYEVGWAKDGREMWKALERSRPAVVLMDIQLPDSDGLTLIRQIKTNTRLQEIPIIAQTAMAMKGDRDLCLNAGAADYISKPIDLNALAQLVARYVSVEESG